MPRRTFICRLLCKIEALLAAFERTQYILDMRWFAAMCLLLTLPAALCAEQESGFPQAVPPKLPFVDRGACPYEGCQYGPWTATKPSVVYDIWKPGRRIIAHLSKGEKVTGLTGLAITYEPGKIRMDRDLPEFLLQRGDTILTYTYHGEGTSAVWFKGRYYPDFDISFARGPDGTGCGGDHCAATYVAQGNQVWWAQVRLNSGRTGWVNMNESGFNGVDALAGTQNRGAAKYPAPRFLGSPPTSPAPGNSPTRSNHSSPSTALKPRDRLYLANCFTFFFISQRNPCVVPITMTNAITVTTGMYRSPSTSCLPGLMSVGPNWKTPSPTHNPTE
jgi:hypothetical protein